VAQRSQAPTQGTPCFYCGQSYQGDPKTCPHCGQNLKIQ
jgi:rRNA maturation endonuclease Nob1